MSLPMKLKRFSLSMVFLLAGALHLAAVSWGGNLGGGVEIRNPEKPGSETAEESEKGKDKESLKAAFEKKEEVGHEAGSGAAASLMQKRLDAVRKSDVNRVVEITLKGTLDREQKERILAALKDADSRTLFVLRISSSGGDVDAANKLSEALLQSPAYTVAFVLNRAQGETALVAVSCNIVIMATHARLGALATDQYGATAMTEAMRERHAGQYEKTAKENNLPAGTVAAFLDKGKTLKIPSDVTANLETWEIEGLEGRNPDAFLWVGPVAAERLGLSAAQAVGSDIRAILGFGHLTSLRDGEEVSPPDDTESEDPLQKIRLKRPRPVDSANLVKDVKRIIVLKIDGVIDMGLAPFVRRVVENSRPTDLIVLDIDTFGGRVDAAVSIRDTLLKSNSPTIAFVNPRAISAGALISLACDLIVMTPGGSMGAATPVQVAAGETKPTDEKVVSYMRKEMKSTAEAKGRRGDLAEAMVDKDVEVRGVPHVLMESISGLQKGKLLTLTTREAYALGMIDMKAENKEALFKKLGLEDIPVKKAAINWAEEIARFLTNPMVAGILLSLGMLGIFIELFTPGVGLPGAVGVACLLLFFLGHFVAGLAGWEHAILFVVGITLLVVEIFITPGFGILGTIGGLAVLASLVMALIGTKTVDFDTALILGNVTRAVGITLGSILVAGVFGFFAVRYLPETRFFNKLVLDLPGSGVGGAKRGGLYLKADSGDLDKKKDDETGPAEGAVGTARTVLRPAGKVMFDRKTFSAVAHGEFIEKGDKVEFVKKEAGRLVVRRAEKPGDTEGGVEGGSNGKKLKNHGRTA